MTFEELLNSSKADQEHYVAGKSPELLKADVYLALEKALNAASEMEQQENPQSESMQDKALRICFFFLNVLGERRLKDADTLPEDEREEAFEDIKHDFELIIRFTESQDYARQYFFKCEQDRIFDLAVFAALSFMGGNPGLEREAETADSRRLACFDVMMAALEQAR